MPSPIPAMQRSGRVQKGTIHVGAGVGEEVDSYHAHGIPFALLIEPIDHLYELLLQKVKALKNFVAVKALCSSRSGVDHHFYVASNSGTSSSILKPERHFVEAPHVQFTEDKDYRSTTVDALVKELFESFPELKADVLNTISISVQGAELYVLKGAGETLECVENVYTTVSNGGLYNGDARFTEVLAFLQCFGFRISYVQMTQHGWGEALFIK